MSNKDLGIISKCYYNGHAWGKCTCKTEVSEDKGFEFGGVAIVDPSLSECGRFFVDPEIYYGKAYRKWVDNLPTKMESGKYDCDCANSFPHHPLCHNK